MTHYNRNLCVFDFQPILPGLEDAMKYTVNQPPHLIKLPIKSVTVAHLKHRSVQTRALSVKQVQ